MASANWTQGVALGLMAFYDGRETIASRVISLQAIFRRQVQSESPFRKDASG